MSAPVRALSTDDAAIAFEAELRPLIGVALRLATAMRLNREDAEDAVQEAALRAWRKRANRRSGTELRPWFLAIVANQCRESRRSRWASVLRFATPPAGSVHAEDVAGSIDVMNAMRGLQHEVRVAVALRFYLDLPMAEVAQISGCSTEAARSRVRRGVEALSAKLGTGGDVA